VSDKKEKENLAKKLISEDEASVLKYMVAKNTKTVTVSDITVATKLDADTVLRALYTLEGKNIVSPEPEGDFTSKDWKVTVIGKKAMAYL